MNVFTFSGNIGRDAEVRYAGQSPVAGFSVAAKSGVGDKAQTVWLDCSIWGKRAEGGLIQYLKKGQQVVVSGELSTREHNGKTYLQCRVNDISLVGGRAEAQGGQQQNQSQAQGGGLQTGYQDFDDSVPF